jgi:hypothetical protein
LKVEFLENRNIIFGPTNRKIFNPVEIFELNRKLELSWETFDHQCTNHKTNRKKIIIKVKLINCEFIFFACLSTLEKVYISDGFSLINLYM